MVVRGKATHWWDNEKNKTTLSASSFFSSTAEGEHKINVEVEVVIYINSNGRYAVEQPKP